MPDPGVRLGATTRPTPAGRALTALLAAAVALPLLVVGIAAWLDWRDAWRGAEAELLRSADAAAQYAERVVGAQVLAAALVNQMLAGLSDAEIRTREMELSERLRRLLPSIPAADTLALSDRHGVMLLTADVAPVPRVSIADREWVRALRRDDAPSVHISAVTAGRVDSSVFFGVSLRRAGTGNGLPEGAFDGVVKVSASPDRMAEGFAAILRAPGDVAALVRADGEVLARDPPFEGRPPPVPASSPFHEAVAAGTPRGTYEGRGIARVPGRRPGEPLLAAFRRVGDLPAVAVVTRRRAVVVAGWRRAVAAQAAVALAASAALAGLALAVRRGQRRLAAREADFRAAFENTMVGIAQADPRTGRFLAVNRRFCEIAGRPRAELLGGLSFCDITHPDEDRDADAVAFEAALRTEGHYETEKRYLRPDGSVVWVAVHVALVPGGGTARGAGAPRTVAAVQDVTERRAGEARQALLAREVDHRAKNALAVVQATLRLTPRDDPDAFVRAVEGRVTALARAQSLLAATRWQGADLRALAEGELAPFLSAAARARGGGGGGGGGGAAPSPGATRAVPDGPPVWVPAEATQPLSMTLHELATNAVKHGALSTPGGRVALSWRLDGEADGALLRLRWEEEGGPPVPGPPERRGFGSRVIEATVTGQLGGRLERGWTGSGLRGDIEVPLRRGGGAGPSAAGRAEAALA